MVTEETRALQPGTKIGEYELVRPLGEGGQGVLYLARRGAREVALKLSSRRRSEHSPADWQRIEGRVRREIATLMSVSHPNVVRLYSAEWWPDLDGYLYIVMEYVQGECFGEWLARARPSLKELCRVVAAVANGLAELHGHGIFHRDLKDDNVLVRSDGQPIIIDFGFARHRSAKTLTEVDGRVGNSLHLSPELCRFVLGASHEASGSGYTYRPSDDMHSLGFLLYEALVGEPPFGGDEDNEWLLMKEIVSKVPARPRVLNPAVPEVLDDLVMRLLSKQGEERPSAEEAMKVLEAASENSGPAWEAPFEAKSTGGARAAAEVLAELRLDDPSLGAPSQPVQRGDGAAAGEAPSAPAAAARLPSISAEKAFVSPAGESAPASASVEGPLLSPGMEGVGERLRSLSPPDKRHRLSWVGMGALALLSLWLFLRQAPPSRAPQSLLVAANPGAPPSMSPPPAVTPAPVPVAAVSAPALSTTTPVAEPPRGLATRSEGGGKRRPVGTPVVRRSLEGTTAVEFADAPQTPSSCRVLKGTLIPARLLASANGNNPGPVGAEVTEDVQGLGGCVALPRGSGLVCASHGARGSRLSVSCDAVSLARGSVALVGLALGKDRQPGLPVRGFSGEGEVQTVDGASAAVDLGQRTASRALLAAGPVGEVANDVLATGGAAARAPSLQSSRPLPSQPVAKGTDFFVFVQQDF